MAVKNISTLNTQADVLLPNNNQQLISPSDVRNAIKDLNDSSVNRLSDKSLLGLKVYDSARTYEVGEGCFYNGVIYEASQIATGTFNPAHWTARSSSNGTWGSIGGSISAQTDLQDLLAAKQGVLSTNMPLFKSGNVLSIQQAGSGQDGYLNASDWTTFNNKENGISVQSPLVRVGNTLEVQYVSETQDGVLSSQNWIDLNTPFIDISYTDALTAISNQSLIKGTYYKVQTGTRINEGIGTKGDIILLAIENNRFGSQGYLQATMPSYESIGGSIAGIWTSDASPNLDDKFIYNAAVYNNLTGEVGSEPATDTINWELRLASEYYKTELDFIEYDIFNDWISFRADKRGNRYSFSRLTSGGAYNAIDSFQWGNDLNYGNNIDNGVLANINEPGQVNLTNQNKSGIFKSLATSDNRTYTFPDTDGTVALLSDINGIVDISHEELLAAIQAGSLVAGIRYQLNDFETIHVIPGTNVVNTGDPEMLLCTAISSNTIDTQVISADNPFDLILYDVQDVLAEDGLTPRKGKIIYRKDIKNNLETWYDFRAVKFRRWKIDGTGMATWAFSTSYTKGQVVFYSGIIYKALVNHNSGIDFFTDLSALKWVPILSSSSDYIAWAESITDFGGTITVNTGQFQDFLTFSTGCKNISIQLRTDLPYNNIVFLNASDKCTFGRDCRDMTIYNGSNLNSIGKGCKGILLFNGANSNTLSDNCTGIIISNGSSYNILDKNVTQIFLSGSCNYNDIGALCQNLFLNGSCANNIFKMDGKYNYFSSGATRNFIGMNCEGNILTNSASGNTIGGNSGNSIGTNNNTITNGAYNNTLEGGCSGNLFTNSANNNKLLNNCSGNTFTNSAYNNLLATYCSNNTFTSSSSYNSLGSGSGNNSFTSASNNSIGQSSSYNVFNYNANGNIIGNRSDFNAFGNNSVGNRLGNYCIGNQVLPSLGYYYGASGQYNVFENYCSNNIINGNYNRLESYCNFIQCTSNVYLSNCFFCSGLQSISFNGTYIIDNLRILLTKGFASNIVVNGTTAQLYNNIVVDMKDSSNTLWYKTISLAGKITTEKFI